MDSNQSYKINTISSKFYDALEMWMGAYFPEEVIFGWD